MHNKRRCQTGRGFDSDGVACHEWRRQSIRQDKRLQYTPNALAVELGRGKGVNPRKRGILVPALAGTKAKLPFYSGADAQNERRQTGRARLLKDEYSRVRRLVVNLSKDLEKLRSIIQ
jgi:hypothetical protein